MKLTTKEISKIDGRIKVSQKEYIVMINVSGDKYISPEISNLNIYRINDDNEIIWQIKEIESERRLFDDMFVYLGMNDKGEIIADRWSGFEYKINPETGEAKCTRFHK